MRRLRAARILVVGGARSGKSRAAERMLARRRDVTYVATGAVPDGTDAEWTHRVERHRAERPQHWHTVETTDLAPVLVDGGGPLIIECISTWLARVMDDCGAWSAPDGARSALAGRTDDLVAAWASTKRHVVAVSNEVGSGVVPATESGRRYRDELGRLNTRLAETADQVWLVTVGIGRRLR
jgi:adenosylcobinamide kinase/adenosylcobinamide-phosphate guanylyltransferase